jgi:hypothetical protein
MEYVVVTVGLTFTLMDGAVPENGIPPVNVPEIVPGPDTLSVIVAVWPLQMVWLGGKTAAGLGFTVMVNGVPGSLQPNEFATLIVPV